MSSIAIQNKLLRGRKHGVHEAASFAQPVTLLYLRIDMQNFT